MLPKLYHFSHYFQSVIFSGGPPAAMGVGTAGEKTQKGNVQKLYFMEP
jgi:hypothetical protein